MNKSDFHILVIDDDLEYAEACVRALARTGFSARAEDSPSLALEFILQDENMALVLTDLQMPEIDGIGLLRAIKSRQPTIEVIIMTGYGTIESAVRAVKAGAGDYITKPFDKHELLNAVNKVFKVWSLQQEVMRLRQIVNESLRLEGFVFKNKMMSKVYALINAAAGCDCSVLIFGKSGTGKELVARAIHHNSLRSNGPFVPVNCSAISETLIESELFGHKKGAFTGADRDHKGLFAAADHGSLFLDEIVEMGQGTQSKLLRSIQENSIRPVGSVDEIPVDVRFIAATNRDLDEALKENLLREDLFHRLNVIQIRMPALYNMREEIPELLTCLMATKAKEHNRAPLNFDEAAISAMVDYNWPGNIREVLNVVEICLLNAKGEIIGINDLPRKIISRLSSGKGNEFIPTFDQAERDLVVRALKQSNGNKSRAAKLLGISRPRLYKKIEDYHIKEV